jgi:hypothetical protein
MTEPSDVKEEVDTGPAYLRVINRMTDGLDNAACIAVMMGLDRETFIKAAEMAFDFIERWHDHAQQERELNS